jgi:hypothetical protein
MKVLFITVLWALIAWAMAKQTEAGRKSLRRFGFWVATVLMGIAAILGLLIFFSPFPGWLVALIYWAVLVLVYWVILRQLRAKQLI